MKKNWKGFKADIKKYHAKFNKSGVKSNKKSKISKENGTSYWSALKVNMKKKQGKFNKSRVKPQEVLKENKTNYWETLKTSKLKLVLPFLLVLVIAIGIGIGGSAGSNDDISLDVEEHEKISPEKNKEKDLENEKEKEKEKEYEALLSRIELKVYQEGSNEQEISIFSTRKENALTLVANKAPVEEIESAIAALDVTNVDISARIANDVEQARLAAEEQARQAELQRIAQEQQAQAAKQPEQVERTVYIAPHSGTKYHYHQNCRGLNNANSISSMPLSSAINQNYTLCGWED